MASYNKITKRGEGQIIINIILFNILLNLSTKALKDYKKRGGSDNYYYSAEPKHKKGWGACITHLLVV